MAKVLKIFVKDKRNFPLIRPSGGEIMCVEGQGINGDINADPFSPRHVLIVENEVLIKFGLKPGDLRENVVSQGLALNELNSGDVLSFGTTTQLRITFECEICSRISHLPLPSLDVLKGHRGILAHIVKSGPIKEEDKIIVKKEIYEAIPDNAYLRFLWLTKQIPNGRVLSYKNLNRLLGRSKSYIRVLPNFIRKALKNTPIPMHRIVSSSGDLIKHVPNQKELLLSESIPITNENVDQKHFWRAEGFYSELSEKLRSA